MHFVGAFHRERRRRFGRAMIREKFRLRRQKKRAEFFESAM
jgi:hypothetical protein